MKTSELPPNFDLAKANWDMLQLLSEQMLNLQAQFQAAQHLLIVLLAKHGVDTALSALQAGATASQAFVDLSAALAPQLAKIRSDNTGDSLAQ